MQIVRYSFPTEIFFGPKASGLLPSKLNALSHRRPLVVTDKGLVERPIVRRLVSRLNENNLYPQVFSEIFGNPVLSQVVAGVSAFRQHDADCVVAIGGGAAMDVAKAIGLMIHHPGHLFDYEDGKATRTFDRPMPFLVALPTTSGTGSEVGRSTVISDDVDKTKKIVFDPILLPKIVFADPELTLDLPSHITASTGMDALSHLLESFIAKGFHPMCDGIALEGLFLLSTSLSKAVLASQNPHENQENNLWVRGQMMNAALMGAVAFQKGLGVTHSCAHALSTVCDLHHGLANGIMLPFAMEFNLSAVSDKFSRVAHVLNLPEKTPGAVVDWLHQLKKEIAIPEKLSTVGVKSDDIESLVKVAIADGCHLSNPREVAAADFKAIFEKAL